MSRFPDVGAQIEINQWARDIVDVSQNDSDEQNRRIRILDGKTTKAYTSGERDNLVNPNVGVLIFNSSLGVFQGYDGVGWLNIYERPTTSNTLLRTVGGRHL